MIYTIVRGAAKGLVGLQHASSIPKLGGHDVSWTISADTNQSKTPPKWGYGPQSLPSGNQTWQWKRDHLSVILLLRPPDIGDFPASHLWLPEGSPQRTCSLAPQ